MIRRWRAALAALLAACALGCGAELGASGGVRTDSPVRFAGGSHVALVGAVPLQRHRLVASFVLDGSAVAKEGSRWLLGARLGYQYEPGHWFWAFGTELSIEGGGPIRDATFAPSAAFYVGGSAGLVIWLGHYRGATERNEGYWFAVPVPKLIPFARVRYHRDDLDPRDQDQWELTAGLALRWVLTSELL